ncbi:MAG: hypothetical protein R3181_11675 [Rubricoccaceae bacterium]|nr:hypothetical protein [Rubricoccaceae bacterium]
MTNEQIIELLKATIDTSGGGISEPQDAEAFIDLTRDQTAVLREVRVETGIRTALNLHTINLSEPVMVAAAEGAEPAAADVVSASRSPTTLTPVEVLCAFDVSFEFLRRNIAGQRINEQLNQLFAKRFGKDIVYTMFMGDTSLAATSRTNKALRVLDGLVKQAEADANVHDYTIPASPSYVSQVFPGMVAALPKDYRDSRDELRFFVSADVYDAYASEIGSRATAQGDLILLGPWTTNLSYKGIQLMPVFGLSNDRVVLTLDENVAIGFGQEMTVGKDIDNRSRLLKVTITAAWDVGYAESDALVLGATA